MHVVDLTENSDCIDCKPFDLVKLARKWAPQSARVTLRACGWSSQLLPSLNISHMSAPLTFIFVLKPTQRAYSICVVVVRHMAVQGRLTPPTISCVSIYRLISMYNGSGSNTSAHTRFAKPLEIRRTSQYPETYSIIHYLSQQLCVTSTGTLMAAKAGTKRPMHGACKPKKATQTIRGEMQASGST